MKRFLIILLAALSLSACMRTVDNYNSEPMLVSTLKHLETPHKKIRVENFQTALGAGVGVHCRAYSAINASLERNDDDESFVSGTVVGGLVRYIQDAFITELEQAGMFSMDAPVSLKGNVTQLSLQTLHKGRWTIKLTMMSNNGRSVSVSEALEFNTSIMGVDPCQTAADNYSHAVKHLIYQLITHPNFKYLLEPSNYTNDYLIEKNKTAAQRRAEKAAQERAEEEAAKRKILGLDDAVGVAPKKRISASKKKTMKKTQKTNNATDATVTPTKESSITPKTEAIPKVEFTPKSESSKVESPEKTVAPKTEAISKTTPQKAEVKTTTPAKPTVAPNITRKSILDESALPKGSNKKKKNFIKFD